MSPVAVRIVVVVAASLTRNGKKRRGGFPADWENGGSVEIGHPCTLRFLDATCPASRTSCALKERGRSRTRNISLSLAMFRADVLESRKSSSPAG